MIMTKTQLSQIPTWDLSSLFNSIDDPRIAQEFEIQTKRAETFAEQYKNKIADLSDSEIIEAIRQYENIMQESAKPEIYAYLLFAADSSDQRIGAFMQKSQTIGTKINEILIFFDLEITNLPDSRISQLISKAGNYAHYIERLVVWKPHRLSEAEEKIFNDKSLTSSSAFRRLFEEELSQYKFLIGKGKRAKELNESEVLNLLYSDKQEIRKEASESLTKGLNDLSRRTTFIYNTLINDKQIGDKYSQFTEPEEPRHLSNESDPVAVKALVEVVTESYPLVQRYYNFKKKLLNLPEIFDYDRYAPIAVKEKKMSYEKAKDQVLKAFRRFSPKYAEYAKLFFDGNWIDAPTRKGKRGGAFCMSCTPDLHPYIMLNFDGKMKDVRTMAHELGHGVHDLCMKHNSYLNYGAPLTLAETSSIFAEMLLFDYQLEQKMSRDEQISLYSSKIEEIFASVHRQIAMFKFEQKAHAKRRAEGELSTPDFNAIWRETQTEMLGSSVTITQNYDIWWSYITHFFESPFYVYAYAFGELLTLSLYAKYKASDDKPKFAENMMKNILGVCGTKSPKDILAPMGIDLTDKNFWREGIKEIDKLITKLESL